MWRWVAIGLTLLFIVRAVPVRGLTLAPVDLGLMVAKTAGNEGALRYRSTTALVWQVVRENGGDSVEERADFLLRHSPRANGVKPCQSGNCLWSPQLNREGTQPPGLVLRADVWALRVQPIWLDTLRYADWLVEGNRKSEDPCPIKPRTWGGPMDREAAMKRGLYPIGCDGGAGCSRDLCNDGFTFYERCWQDGLWVCDPAVEPVLQSVPEPEGMASL